MSNKTNTPTFAVKIISTNTTSTFSTLGFGSDHQKHYGKVTYKTAKAVLAKYIPNFERSNGVKVLKAQMIHQHDFSVMATYEAA